MAPEGSRKMTQETMLVQIEQVLKRGKASDPPAYTLILGAGASFGSVPTAKQMLGIQNANTTHPQCIPAWLRRREDDVADLPPEELDRCVKGFWKRFLEDNPSFVRDANPSGDNEASISLKDGVPDDSSIAQAYTAIFNQGIAGGINTAAEARTYLRETTLPVSGQVQLNGTHFFLASLLSLQRRIGEASPDGKPPYIGRRPFARTIFTTNFDPLLQTSLQLFQLLYYMTDRPDRLSADALQTDDHSAIHLFYAHGSVHRPFLANTRTEIEYIASRNEREIASYIGGHGVIVLGYSGWDDCLLRALQQTSSFAHNLYWLARNEASLSPRVSQFLREHPNAYWVQISDGGEFMASLHRRLCPGMRNTELLSNPIRPLREQLQKVVLTGIEPEKPAGGVKTSRGEGVASTAKPTTPEEFRRQILQLLLDAENRLSSDVNNLDPAARLRQAEHQGDLAYSNANWNTALSLYTTIIEDSEASTDLRAKALARRGFAYGRLGKVDLATTDYNSVVGLADAPAEQVGKALLNRGVLYGEKGRADLEIIDYTKVIGLPGASAEQVALALMNRGITYGQQGKPELSVADYNAAIDLPDAPTEQVAMALVNRSFYYTGLEQWERAIADCTRVIDLPNVPPDQMIKALFNRGISYGRHNRPDLEIADYTKIIDSPGASAEMMARAFVNRGLTYSDQSKYEQAAADFTKVIDLPGAPAEQLISALLYRGISYGEQGKAEQAISDITKVIDSTDTPVSLMAKALFSRGLNYVQQGKPEQAFADYTRVINLPDAPAEQVEKARKERETLLSTNQPARPAS